MKLPFHSVRRRKYKLNFSLSGWLFRPTLPITLICLSVVLNTSCQPISPAQVDTLIVVSTTGEELLAEETVVHLEEIPGVSTVEKYLVTKIGKYDVIGMEPGTRGLILTENSLIGIKVNLGRWFEVWEDHAAVIGTVYMEDFGEGPPEHDMQHPYSVGAVIRLGERKVPVRVIGVYASSTPVAASKIFVPLIKAQQWFNKPKLLSYAVISLTTTASPNETTFAIRQNLPPYASIQVLSRPREKVSRR